jgi:hypothetical protein
MTRKTIKLATACATLLCIALASCVGGAQAKSPGPSPTATSPTPPPSASPRTKIVRTPVLVKETRYVGKDVLDSWIVYDYSANYAVLQDKLNFDAQRSAPVSKTVYEQSNGLVVSETIINNADKSSSGKISYAYDSAGRRTEEKRRDGAGNVLITSRYEYNADGQRKAWRIYLADELLVAETLYEYSKGQLTRIVMKNGKNEYQSAIDITRDKKGRELSRINKTITNITESFEEYGYDGDRLAWERKTGPSGKLLLSVAYDYKGAGALPDRKTIKAPDGKVKEYTVYEYAYKEEEVPIE